MDLREAIINLRDQIGLSRVEVCARMGTTPPTPESWLTRRELGTTRIKLADVPRIARGLGVTVQQIRKLAPDAFPGDLARLQPANTRGTVPASDDAIPIVNLSEDGSAWPLDSIDLSNPAAVRGVPRYNVTDPDAIAIVIPDSQLLPDFRPGDTVILTRAPDSDPIEPNRLGAWAAHTGHPLSGMAFGFLSMELPDGSIVVTHGTAATLIQDPGECLAFRPARLIREWEDDAARFIT